MDRCNRVREQHRTASSAQPAVSVGAVTLGRRPPAMKGKKMPAWSSTRAVEESPARTEHLGAWQALATAPPMFGSLLLLVVLLAPLGPWELPALLGWLGSAAALRATSGERLAARLSFGFRRPTRAESAVLASVWAAALRRAGVDATEIDLYVYRSPWPNAVTLGRRSIALSTGILQDHRVGRLAADELLAVLVHELGHLATRTTSWTLAAAWLAAPARLVFRALGRVVAALAGRQPRPMLALLAMAVVLVAVVRAVDRHDWVTAAVLTGVTVVTVLAPLAHAAISRRSELAADRFAADCGLAAPLASALRNLARNAPDSPRRRPLLASHPSLSERIDALAASAPPR